MGALKILFIIIIIIYMLFKNASACDSVACKVIVFCFPLVTDEFHQASDTAAGVHVVPDEVP